MRQPLQATCPKCGVDANGKREIKKIFGFRNDRGIERIQSRCHKCR